jgi:hypothetical protein
VGWRCLPGPSFTTLGPSRKNGGGDEARLERQAQENGVGGLMTWQCVEGALEVS